MLGAIAGDMIGSIYEFDNIKVKDFPLFSKTSTFTDDSILTIAIADAVLNDRDYQKTLRDYVQRYPNPMGRYGSRFWGWATSEASDPYNSWGNGSAMRVSAIGFAFDDLESVLLEAQQSAAVSHNHPEGIKGAQATAAAIFLGRQGQSKAEIRSYIETNFGYDLSQTVDDIRPVYQFNESCQKRSPKRSWRFLNQPILKMRFEMQFPLAVIVTRSHASQAAAEAFYKGVPELIAYETMIRLDQRLYDVVEAFQTQYVACFK